MTDSAIELKEISKDFSFGNGIKNVIQEIDLIVDKGKFVLITGESGVGKSTLLNIMGLLSKPNSGELKIFGNVSNDENCDLLRRAFVSFVFQETVLLEALTIRENIDLMRCLWKKNKKGNECFYENVDEIDLEDAVDSLGLREYLETLPGKLSGGQKRRAMILMAVAKNSPIMLLDEPTNDLDSKWVDRVLDFTRRLTSCGTTIIMVSHDKRAENYCDEIYEVIDGELRTIRK
ncbi:MAG: ATP-binding cassette domain-containing protein [Peptostreptococcus porci]|uniref:ATP-binding cassette domain-containing protein n=1 Tax=Peptostreptococcus porci TaxID=2652282 RepID=A0A6N7XEX4_9FIRM|nr:ATP-binding cassette domain-containing protein [Peptostreptococcus porci]MDY5479513.1 ATP-binding cassette domain-containing protein [Peptostreptococcus porci]MST61867.1 ATP-binding cassette domain-containing protein [Peptostreptococcus porci]